MATKSKSDRLAYSITAWLRVLLFTLWCTEKLIDLLSKAVNYHDRQIQKLRLLLSKSWKTNICAI